MRKRFLSMSLSPAVTLVPIILLFFYHSSTATGGPLAQAAEAPTNDLRRPRPSQRIAGSTDVRWLEKVAGSDEVAGELAREEDRWGQPGQMRMAAYIRLGEIGSDESIAALKRIEDAAKRRPLTPKTVPLSDALGQLFASAKAPDGMTYAVTMDESFGDLDPLLLSSATPGDKSSWSRPRLLPFAMVHNVKKATLAISPEGVATFSWVQEEWAGGDPSDPHANPRKVAPGPHSVTFTLADVLRDQDSDGWTDVEEERFGLSPTNPDTDGDGLTDGADPCPDFAAPAADARDEDAEIVQRAFFVEFGLGWGGSRSVLLAGGKRVHVWGYGGPVLYAADADKWLRLRGYGVPRVSWQVKKSGDEASVYVSWYEAPLAAAGQTVTLRKIRGTWVVVNYKPEWIS